MGVLNKSLQGGLAPRIGYRGLAAILGVVTLGTFGTERYLLETAGQSLGELPAYVMGAVLLAVGVSAFHASVNGNNIRTAVLLAAGPTGGFIGYLLGYHLVLSPSADSPTTIIFLAFAGGLLAVGTVAHLCGRFAKNWF